MMKHLSFLVSFALAMLLLGCGGGGGGDDGDINDSNKEMAGKDAVMINHETVEGMCEKPAFQESILKELSSTDVTGVLFHKKTEDYHCSTYGKEAAVGNDKGCQEIYYGKGDETCVIGFDMGEQESPEDGNESNETSPTVSVKDIFAKIMTIIDAYE